ncbi:hypothetical protein AWC38_SpisGene6927 [Stylophora pistillata]|uniref:Death domain-containing protein n=1 Tax=Stylophora pistillata TaxID=50429 RepID=A0A2B4SHK2_STYPI|nr:hypothetical protein AWC38_SpisGene6927 [Stylophora pistillata]
MAASQEIGNRLEEMAKKIQELENAKEDGTNLLEGLKEEVSEQSMRFKEECAQLGENLEEKLKKNWGKLEDYVKELSQLRGDAKEIGNRLEEMAKKIQELENAKEDGTNLLEIRSGLEDMENKIQELENAKDDRKNSLISASSMPSPQEKDSRIEIRADAVEETYTETPLSREQPSVRETSAFVESPEDDLALIGELRNRTVTQRIATRCQAHIGNCWRTLGVFFEIDESVLNNIETDFPTAEEKGFKVLEIWRDKEGRSATVRCLEDALLEIGKRRIAENILDIVREERGRESKQKGDRSKGFRKLENESERVKRLENVRRDNVENRKPAAGEPSKTPLKKKRSKSSGATKKKADIVKEADINY